MLVIYKGKQGDQKYNGIRKGEGVNRKMYKILVTKKSNYLIIHEEVSEKRPT